MTKAQLEYLKAWVMRTKSDAVVPNMEVQMMPNVINNLNELEKWLDNPEPAPTAPKESVDAG